MSEWIKKKEKPKAYITKKEKPKAYITKKEKPKAWITKKEKPKAWITKKKTVDPKKTLRSAGIEAKIESAKDKVTPLKSDRVTGRGEKKVTFKPGEGASLSNRGTTGSNWRAGKDRVEKWFTSGDAAKNYKKTGKLFTNYSGKMNSNKRSIDRAPREQQYGRKKDKTMAKGGRASYNSGGAVLKGKKVGCQIK